MNGGWQKRANHSTNLWENLLFYISVVDQKNLNLGEVIAWTISIVKKKKIAIAACLKEFNLLVLLCKWSIRSYAPGETDTRFRFKDQDIFYCRIPFTSCDNMCKCLLMIH